jgi:tetratricopeptide (TPR) repeat protein
VQALLHAGRAGEAAAVLHQLVARHPRDAGLLYALGRALRLLGDDSGAEVAYRDALRRDPTLTDAWVSLGTLLKAGGRLAESETCQRRAVALEPRNVPALVNFGNVIRAQGGRLPEAIEAYRAAQDVAPDSREATLALAASLYEDGRFEESIVPLQRACTLEPTDVACTLRLVQALLATGRAQLALGHAEQLLATRGGTDAVALRTLAVALMYHGDAPRAGALLESALELAPKDAEARNALGMLRLREGEFASGWEAYEARLELPAMFTPRHLPRPRWAGQSLHGRTLLIAAEQGLGDEIMFASLVPELTAESGRCLLECDQRLAGLFGRSFDCTIIGVARHEPEWTRHTEERLPSLPAVDYWSPAGSLPRLRRRSATDFPAHRGYLRADPARVARARERLDSFSGGRRIGLAWSGGTPQTRRAERSMPLAALATALAPHATALVSLQHGDPRAEVLASFAGGGPVVHHWPEVAGDLEEMAAMICALDLVVTTCGTLVHLAGALGHPVWVLAPHAAEWRYGSAGTTMAWYPSARVFRQSTPGAWDDPLAAVARALREPTNPGAPPGGDPR